MLDCGGGPSSPPPATADNKEEEEPVVMGTNQREGSSSPPQVCILRSSGDAASQSEDHGDGRNRSRTQRTEGRGPRLWKEETRGSTNQGYYGTPKDASTSGGVSRVAKSFCFQKKMKSKPTSVQLSPSSCWHLSHAFGSAEV